MGERKAPIRRPKEQVKPAPPPAPPLKQTRFVSGNTKKKFSTSADFFEEMGGRLYACCECDGRGCTICIAADALKEAAYLVREK